MQVPPALVSQNKQKTSKCTGRHAHRECAEANVDQLLGVEASVPVPATPQHRTQHSSAQHMTSNDHMKIDTIRSHGSIVAPAQSSYCSLIGTSLLHSIRKPHPTVLSMLCQDEDDQAPSSPTQITQESNCIPASRESPDTLISNQNPTFPVLQTQLHQTIMISHGPRQLQTLS